MILPGSFLIALVALSGGAGAAFAAEPRAPLDRAPTPSGRDSGGDDSEVLGFSQPGFELPDVSAWTLRDGELELGPTAVRYGFLDLFQVGTRFALNLFGALNGEAKWTIHAGERVAVAVDGGVLRYDPELVGIDDDFDLWAFPIALRVSGKPSEDFRVHGAIEFLSYEAHGVASDEVLRIQRYLGPVGRLAARLGGEWRATEHIALYGELAAPLMLHKEVFRYVGEDDPIDFLRAELAVQLVYDAFNLRVGGGYGPSFLGKAGLFPVFELSFRIY